MNGVLQGYAGRLEKLAQEHGLDYYPVQFEEVPSSFMMEVAVYGLPVRMPHWSFGVRYIYQLIQHRMGHSRLFEVVFPGNPGRAYLAGNNSLQENTLVTAHVLGHADFAKNNSLFKRSQEQVGYRIVEQAAAHAREIGTAVEQYGQTRVEQVLDAALALEAHIDPIQPLRRNRYPHYLDGQRSGHEGGFHKRFENLPGSAVAVDAPLERTRAPIPPAPERDLLWFIAEYAPELEEWERWFDKLALGEAINSLSERERLIVYLRYYRDQTQSEVASRLGISQVQVSRLEKKILQSIKDQIAQ